MGSGIKKKRPKFTEGFRGWDVLGVYLETMAEVVAHVQLTRRARHWDSREQCAFVDKIVFMGKSRFQFRRCNFLQQAHPKLLTRFISEDNEQEQI
jgi:hypothetical protein